MEQIITIIVSGLCGIITAAAGLVISYLHKKTKQRRETEDKRTLNNKIEHLNNGFRDHVYDKDLNRKFDKLQRDVTEVKKLAVDKVE